MILFLSLFSIYLNEYVDFQRNFKITLLDGYQVSAANSQNPFLYIGKDLVRGSYPNLNIVQAQQVSDDIINNTDNIVNQLKDKLPNYFLLRKEKFSFQDSKSGAKLYGAWVFNGKKLKNIQYYFLMNGFFYIATGTSLANEFEHDLKFFEETILSIKKLN